MGNKKKKRAQAAEVQGEDATNPESTGSSAVDVVEKDNETPEASLGNDHGNSSNSSSSSDVVVIQRELPNACLGPGPKWHLRAACTGRINTAAVKEGMPSHYNDSVGLAEGLLQQALHRTKETDMVFWLDDGTRIGGHKGVLRLKSGVFRAMFEVGMKEDEEGIVKMPGVGSSSVRALLEWVYLGRAGEECEKADGRELWVLAEMYDVPGVREWLRGEGLDVGNMCAACEFGLVPEGDRGDLVQACEGIAKGGLWEVSDSEGAGLCGVGVATVSRLLSALVGAGEKGRTKMKEGFHFLSMWWKANGGPGGKRPTVADVEVLVGLLDLSLLRKEELRDIVKPSGLVSAERMVEIYEKKLDQTGDLGEGGCLSAKRLLWPDEIKAMLNGESFKHLAVHGRGAEQVLAFSTLNFDQEKKNQHVHIINVATGKLVATLQPRKQDSFDGERCGLAFNRRGDLFVSTGTCIDVYDGAGRLVRTIGESGASKGKFADLRGLACAPGGDLVAGDCGNCCVHVVREDGSVVRSFGSKGSGDGQFGGMHGVAVGHDGTIAAADHIRCRVHLFDSEGKFVRSIGSREEGEGEGEGPLKKPLFAGIGMDGEIFVSDETLRKLFVFSREG